MIDKEPELMDEVKNKINDVVGTVIAKYPYEGSQHLDVRTSNDKICYCTPASNWKVIKLCDELEGL